MVAKVTVPPPTAMWSHERLQTGSSKWARETVSAESEVVEEPLLANSPVAYTLVTFSLLCMGKGSRFNLEHFTRYWTVQLPTLEWTAHGTTLKQRKERKRSPVATRSLAVTC